MATLHNVTQRVASEDPIEVYDAAEVVVIDSYTSILGSFVASIVRLTPRDGLFGEFYFLRWSDGVANEWIEGFQHYRDASARLGELVTAVSNDELMSEQKPMRVLVGPPLHDVAGTTWSDSFTLAYIHRQLDGKEWSPDTLDDIAQAVTRSGREVREPQF
jgi:hypothetical protein